MSQHQYSFYLKTETGHRGNELLDVVSFSVTLRWNEISKWTMNGAGTTPCPMKKNSEIIVYRGSEPWFSGYVTKIEDKYTAQTGIYDWEVDGVDDIARLEQRVIYPDPANEDVQAGEDVAYNAEGKLPELLLGIIRRNISYIADLPDRRIASLRAQDAESIGDDKVITVRYETMLKYILEQLKDGTLGLRSVWDGNTGVSEIQIIVPEDVSNTVIFSVESGSLSAWSRKRSAPKGNVIIVTGCEITKDVTDEETGKTSKEPTGEFQTMIVQDDQSIAEWGRYELYIQHSDIKPVEEKDEETGEITYTEPWDSVRERLKQAALADLEKNSGEESYELTTVELDQMQYKTHWDLGDIVKVRIGNDEFTAPIEEIKVKYSGGIETITPTVGGLQKGELQLIFDEMGALQNKVSVLQKLSETEISSASQAEKIQSELGQWAYEYEEEDGDEEKPAPTTLPEVIDEVAMMKKYLHRLRQGVIDMIN